MRRIILFPLAALAVLAALSPGAAEITSAERQAGLKVIRFLDKIETDALLKKKAMPGRMDFTEDEFNAYIACRIDAEKDPVMKELKLKLFDRNRIEGKIFIDLRGHKIPAVLKSTMNLYFEGVFATDRDRIRLDFHKLYLDGQRIPILVLDVIIYVAAKLGKADAGSIHDWYDLPPGVKDLKTTAGGVSVYF